MCLSKPLFIYLFSPAPSMFRGPSQTVSAGRDLRGHFLHFANQDRPSVKGTKGRGGKLRFAQCASVLQAFFRAFHPIESLDFFIFLFWVRKLSLEFQDCVQGQGPWLISTAPGACRKPAWSPPPRDAVRTNSDSQQAGHSAAKLTDCPPCCRPLP